MSTVVTIRLDNKLAKSLAKASKESGRSRSELIREALERQIALQEFRRLRAGTLPYASRAGYITDEDVIRDVS